MKTLIFKDHFTLDFVSRMLAWHGNFYLRRIGSPLSAGVYLTSRCNARCLMCELWKNGRADTYPREAQERAIRSLAALGCYYYSISGGEPTLVPDLVERVAYAAARIPYVHLVTNGLTMTAELAQALGESRLKEISISVDGTERFHDTLRGVKGAHARAWRAVELVREHMPQVQLVVNTVLSRNNLEGVRALCSAVTRIPGVYQKVLPLSSHGLFGTHGREEPEIAGERAPLDEMERFLDEAVANPRIVNSAVFLRKAKRFFRGDGELLPEQKHCLYPYHAIEFDPQGCAYPCRTGMDFREGIPPDADLVAEVRSAAYRSLQRRLRGCRKCRGSMMLCYYEPRLNFPFPNLVRGLWCG